MKPSTIAAISTPNGVGGIAVIRISGEETLAVASRIFRPYRGNVPEMPGHTCLAGRVVDSKGELDEGVLTVFRAPRSYTGEDVAEISVHGGLYLAHAVLEACFEAGARPAEPGEFTRRACENGKLSLTQAEAVADLIAAEGRSAARAALAARDGALYKALQAPTDTLLALDAHFAAYIDFPEEEVPELEPEAVLASLNSAEDVLSGLMASEKTGRQLRFGIRTVLAGKPNAGKSSLMNQLAGRKRSIVTAVPGTTRDVVEEVVDCGGYMLRLADTAGIHFTEDIVEQEGVRLAEEQVSSADLILAVFDGSSAPDEDDRRVLESCLRTEGIPVIAILNKSDLGISSEMREFVSPLPCSVELSAVSGDGLPALREAVLRVCEQERLDPTAAMLANDRQRNACAEALEAVSEAKQSLLEGWTLDVVSVPVRSALSALMELRGDSVTEQVLEQVFSRFCVGK